MTILKPQRQKQEVNSCHQNSKCYYRRMKHLRISPYFKNDKKCHEVASNNDLAEGIQAYEHLLEIGISILCLPNLSNSSTTSITGIGL